MINLFQKEYTLLYLIVVSFFISFMIISCEKQVTVLSSDEDIYYGFIYIDSNPRGASIFQNGKNTGRFTPDSLRYLPSGRYSITLKLKYYRDTTISVQLQEPGLKEFFVDYSSNPLMSGGINFTSDPSGAEIYVNDSSLQKITPFLLKDVRPGVYDIKYKKMNYRSGVLRVIVESNVVATSYFKLRDTSKWVDYQTSNSMIPSNLITCVEVDINNIKWLGSLDKGLISFDGITFTNFSKTNSPIPSNNIKCIAVDYNNKKWIGTDDGIAVFDNSSWKIYTKNNSALPNNIINSIEFEGNAVWMGTPAGLVKFNGVDWLLYDTIIVNTEPQFAVINDLAMDINGNKWLATAATGIFKFNNGFFGNSFLDSVPGVPTNNLITNCVSTNNEIWFGHLPGVGKRGGVSVYNGNIWKSMYIGTDANLIEDIYIDETNTKWISTNEGLFQIEGANPLFFYNRNNSLISFSHIKAVARDANGLIWIATYGGGLNKLKL